VIIDGMKWVASASLDTRFVDGLPTALIKPLSGSGARGMMVDTMKTFGADSFPGKLSAILQGSSDTTFYVIAVYFGSVGIKNTRYTVGSMLLADLVGVITAIVFGVFVFWITNEKSKKKYLRRIDGNGWLDTGFSFAILNRFRFSSDYLFLI
jgi:spore maturation protein SpmB